MILSYASFQLASTIHVEALNKNSLAIYNEKFSQTQIIDASFHWLIELLASPTSYSEIKTYFSSTYPDTNSEDISNQVDELLTVFIKNQLIHKVT